LIPAPALMLTLTPARIQTPTTAAHLPPRAPPAPLFVFPQQNKEDNEDKDEDNKDDSDNSHPKVNFGSVVFSTLHHSPEALRTVNRALEYHFGPRL
jgi:hypothetical protein